MASDKREPRMSHILSAFNESLRYELQAYVYPHLERTGGMWNHARLNGALSDAAFCADLSDEYDRLKELLKSACFLTVFVTGHNLESKAIMAARDAGVRCGLVVWPMDEKKWHALPHVYQTYDFIVSVGARAEMPDMNDLYAYLPKIEYTRSLAGDGAKVANRIARAVDQEITRLLKASGQYFEPSPGPYVVS